MQKNRYFIAQLYNFQLKRFYTVNELSVIYNLRFPYVIYYTLIHSIPEEWKILLEGENYNEFELSNIKLDTLISKKNATKWVYKQLLENLTVYPTHTINKWEVELEILDIKWKNVFLSIYKCTNCVKLRNFQFKLCHRIIPLNNKLYEWGIVESTLCDFCHSDIDSYMHRFWLCNVVANILGRLYNIGQIRI